jgi:hypothetical protein
MVIELEKREIVEDSRVDPRGVIRGECTLCDCKAYEISESGACSYCQHPPPAHQSIENEEIQIDLESGVLEVNATFWLGNYRMYVMVPFVIVLYAGCMFTFGLFYALVGFVVLSCYFCWYKPYYRCKLKFDNDQKLMYSAHYDPIPYDQLRIKPVLEIAKKCKASSWYGGIYSSEVRHSRRCCCWCLILHPRTDDAPIYSFMDKKKSVKQLKAMCTKIVDFTKIAYSEPDLEWDVFIDAINTRRRRQ